MRSVKPTYLPHLDGLRALAVSSVVIFHAFPKALPGGYLGVDVFFVISGYLISGVLQAEFSEPGASGLSILADFYRRRIRRIFPALLILLAVVYAIGWFNLLPTEFAHLSLQVAAGAGFFANILFSRETGYFDLANASNPVLHLWSLAEEEQFYLVWPLVLWAVVRCRLRLFPSIVFLAALSYLWNSGHMPTPTESAFFLPQNRMWELLVGAAAAVITPVVRPGPSRSRGIAWLHGDGLSILGLALIAVSIVRIRPEQPLPNCWMLATCVGAACIACADVEGWLNRRIMAWKPLVGIGLISYPLYLWHWPILAYTRVWFGDATGPTLLGAAIGASLAAAWVTYQFVERPIRRQPARGWRVAALAGAMGVAMVVAWVTYRGNGFASRYPSFVQSLSAFSYDPAAAWRDGSYHLRLSQDETSYPANPSEIAPGKPTIFLWGDSHAAALYGGLQSVYGGQFNIVQRTAAGVPPFMGDRFNQRSGASINRFIFQKIVRDRPDFVVLDANWPQYEWHFVEETVTRLIRAKIKHVVVVGPMPEWQGSLPAVLFHYIKHHRGEPVPTRLKEGIVPESLEVDDELAGLCRKLDVTYVSPRRILENEQGFLTRTDDSANSLIVFDYGHLTLSGAKYLVGKFPPFVP